jgi:hypothetical protein
MGGERQLDKGRRSTPCAVGPGGGGAASQKGRLAGRRPDSEKTGEQRNFYVGKAAKWRQPRSGGAKPETAAHRNLDYI